MRFVYFACAALFGVIAVAVRFLPVASLEKAGDRPGRVSIPSGIAAVSSTWWDEAVSFIERSEYEPRHADQGLQAPNRAQGFRTRFLPARVEVVARRSEAAGAWRFAWRTVRWGRPGQMTNASAGNTGTPAAAGARVVYARQGLVEWYENTKHGLEQGFTLDRRPPGEGQLIIEGSLGGNLRPTVRGDEGIDLVDDHGTCILRYGALHVWDAKQREIPSRLAVAGNQLSILIDDDAATSYPLTVDPLITGPSWALESDQLFAHLGASVSTAGDVDGDGYSDILIGAPQFDNGQDLEGRAFVFRGSRFGPSLTPAWTGESNTTNARYGSAVATAGDVNADGYADILIAAYAYSNGQTSEGKVYLYRGSQGGVANTPAWTVESNQIGAFLGSALGPAGDVNGDGLADVIIGASHYDNGQMDEGRALLYHGTASGLAASPAWMAEPGQPSAKFGVSVGTAGDVNGDGYADVIVGAEDYDNGQMSEGRAYVYHGSSSGLLAAPAWTAEPNQTAALFARSVSTAGDVNGDGYADVIVGASGYSNGEASEGRAFVYHGAASGLGATPAWTQESNDIGALLGTAVGTAGDVNGDGYADVIIGSPVGDGDQPREGRASVYQGSAAGLALNAAWSGESHQTDSGFGTSLRTAGDVNGDGYSDVLVGAPQFDNGQGDEGKVFLYLGGGDPLSLAAAWSYEPNVEQANLGNAVDTAGDVNGDGYDDIIIAASGYDNGAEEEGRAFVFHGSAAGLSATPAWSAEGNQIEARFGTDVAGAGDVNGDGYDDIIVGAEQHANGQTREGRAYVYRGSSSGLGASAWWIGESNQASAYFGSSVDGAGDVNGDGYADVIVGARSYTNDEPNEGRAFVYRGSPSGLGQIPFWIVESNQEGSGFGAAVALAGDVDADGYSDIVIGAPSYDNGQDSEGRAFVFLGAPSSPGTVPVWTGESNENVAFYGHSVGTAGDVSGDGFADIIVGAPNFDSDLQNVGRAYVYNGSPTGPYSVHSWLLEGNQSNGLLGQGVGTAGDVNGDGYSDVIVGVPTYDNGEMDEGRAYVFHGGPSGLSAVPEWTAEGNVPTAVFGIAVNHAGDVNGDGFSDVVVGSYGYTNGAASEGRAQVYYGNGGDGLHRIPRQARTDDTARIGLLGRSNSQNAVRLKTIGRTPAGRGRVRLQFEVDILGSPFDGMDLVTGGWVNTGTPGAAGSMVPMTALASGLPSGTQHRWRLRILTDSPFFPRSRWLSLSQNSVTESDFRTLGAIAVDDPGLVPPASTWLGQSTPNPFTTSTEIAYELPESGKVQLTVYDVQGRAVARLINRSEPAGRHIVRWDGRDGKGTVVPAGVYFVRLESLGHIESQKLVRIPR